MPHAPAIPASVAAALEGSCGSEDVLIAVASDITRDNSFGEEWLLATDKELFVVITTDRQAELVEQYALADIEKIEAVSLIGASLVEVHVKGKPHRLISYSNALNPDFSWVVEDIRDLKDGKQLDPDRSDRKKKICPTCGLPLPQDFNTCPRCTDKKKTLSRILGFVRPYKKMLVFMFLAMSAGTGFSLITPYMSKLFIDYILKRSSDTGLYEYARWLPLAALALLLAYALQLFFAGIHERISGTLGFRTVYDVRARIYEKLQELSLGYFDKHQTGSIMARVNQDTSELQRFMVDFIPLTVESAFVLVGIGIFLFVLSWQLTLFIFIPIVASVLFLKNIFSRIHSYFRRFFHRRSRLSALVNDSVSGMRVIKAFGQENEEVRKFDTRSASYRDAGIELTKKWSVYHPILHFFIMFGSVLVWYVGGELVLGGKMTLGSVVAYSGYLMMFYRPIFVLTRMIQLISNSLAAAERIFDVIDTEPHITDAPDAVAMPRIEGEMVFSDVAFGYNRFKPVIKGISFTIAPNEIIGLVGKSGAGKSTIINLFCRLYDVNTGSITVDGTDVRNIRYADLRRQIGVVLQETFLFNGTIFENIAYSRPDATREQVIEASVAANAHEFIINKPDGYDTQVGERGNSLSGGEKQRISIARAILRDPRILILDEATSSVDTETEKKIQDALEKLMKGRTVITIAHRLSTLRNCHRLFVIEEGKLVEQGSHTELMEKEGIFHKLVTMQQQLSEIIAVKG